MQKIDNTAVIYYTGSVLMSAAFCLALMATVDWPMLAEIPLSISIFIELIAISKSIFSLVEKADSESLEQVYSRLKGGVFDRTSEEEASYIEQ